ncbi:MAG: heavy-metal-associated domain-containing protein [Proteobacteria bacterium]|jgi:copper chaperone|nr:heavy-metal-associated domain-containing protein [Pseudomonadota bacterium]HOL37187.1 heavy-metal-associated domain-containing protein [Rubrivivax sp.]
MQFHLDDMTCGGCARSVTKAIQTLDPEARIEADPPNRRVEVTTHVPREQVAAALRAAGFPPREP